DKLPNTPGINVVGAKPEPRADITSENKDSKQPDPTADAKGASSAPKPTEKAADKKAAAEIKPGQSLDDRQKAFDGWKKQIAEKRKQVDQLAHDLDNFQHNSKLASHSTMLLSIRAIFSKTSVLSCATGVPRGSTRSGDFRPGGKNPSQSIPRRCHRLALRSGLAPDFPIAKQRSQFLMVPR